MKGHRYALARHPKIRGEMSRLEAEFQSYLKCKLMKGEIEEFAFQPEKLRLADRTHYTPDFRVVELGREVTFYEVKGFWEDDARVKIKVAAEMHPYRFVAVMKGKHGWEFETIGNKEPGPDIRTHELEDG